MHVENWIIIYPYNDTFKKDPEQGPVISQSDVLNWSILCEKGSKAATKQTRDV